VRRTAWTPWAGEQGRDRLGVLAGEDLGGRHQRGLTPAATGVGHGEEGDDGLAEPTSP
jgi:hypothetical protein